MAASEPPAAIVCVGMAGSGKTTFMQRINAHLHNRKEPPYVVNLDPAVLNVPFDSNIDIRDTVNYKEVMKQYNLGPNGGIITSLNLFSTKIDQVLGLLEKRTAAQPPSTDGTAPQKPIKNILVDTPGQIEVFVWSASGDILLNALASSFPTVIAYVIDTPRTSSTSTFMSNMLYACSILYKTKLPMILVFNKTDVKDAEFAKEWMKDWESFQKALRSEEEKGNFGGGEGNSAAPGGSGYMGSLLNSMCMVLEEFYKHLSVVGVSSMTGDGVDEFFDAVAEKKAEFLRDYQPELQRRKQEREGIQNQKRERDLDKMLKDMNVTGSAKTKARSEPVDEPETVSDVEDDSADFQGRRIGLHSDDEDDSAEEGDADVEDDDGLQQRYMRAVQQHQEDHQMEDAVSFARFAEQMKRAG